MRTGGAMACSRVGREEGRTKCAAAGSVQRRWAASVSRRGDGEWRGLRTGPSDRGRGGEWRCSRVGRKEGRTKCAAAGSVQRRWAASVSRRGDGGWGRMRTGPSDRGRGGVWRCSRVGREEGRTRCAAAGSVQRRWAASVSHRGDGGWRRMRTGPSDRGRGGEWRCSRVGGGEGRTRCAAARSPCKALCESVRGRLAARGCAAVTLRRVPAAGSGTEKTTSFR